MVTDRIRKEAPLHVNSSPANTIFSTISFNHIEECRFISKLNELPNISEKN